MYIKNIAIENTGPISFISKFLPFNDQGDPKPLVIIGQNGAGKSIFISQIVNALIIAKQGAYENHEVEVGKLFMYISPEYIKLGSSYSYSKVSFEQGLYRTEWQLDRNRNDYEEFYKHTPLHQEWQKIDPISNSNMDSNFPQQNVQLKKLLDNNCVLYFPANRFEEPGWLNFDNLINKAEYRFTRRISSDSNRSIINYSPLKDNQNWLLDLIFDRSALELQTEYISLPLTVNEQILNYPFNIFHGYNGESTNILKSIILFLKSLFQTEANIRFGVGKRRDRKVEIIKDEQPWIPNLFNLSTGETLLLNIFLTIIKDFDLSSAPFETLADIKGIVVIDEIDIHLHSQLQYAVLPELIKLLPKVQFIMTSHSPLFLLGLKNAIGSDNFEILNLPNGDEIDVEGFSEFESAYTYFKDTVKFQDDVKREINESYKALLFVEGDYDVKYLLRAAELLNQQQLLDSFKIIDSVGHGNITNVAKHFDSKLAEVTPQKMLLLYDCDQIKPDSKKGNVYKRVMPTMEANPIKKGIENLFPWLTIEKAIEEKEAYIDITPGYTKKVRAEDVDVPEVWEVNINEKKNLCDWIITNGTAEDFAHFENVFLKISQVLAD